MSEYFADKLTEVRSMSATNDTDWVALQAVAEGVELIDAGAGAVEVFWLVRGYDVNGAVVTGTCTAALISVEKDDNGDTVAVAGGAEETSVPFGAAMTTELKGARWLAPRISSLSTAAATLKVFMRRVP